MFAEPLLPWKSIRITGLPPPVTWIRPGVPFNVILPSPTAVPPPRILIVWPRLAPLAGSALGDDVVTPTWLFQNVPLGVFRKTTAFELIKAGSVVGAPS